MKKTKANSQNAEFTSDIAVMRKKCISDINVQSTRILSLYDLKEQGLGEDKYTFGDADGVLRQEIISQVFDDEMISQRTAAIIDEKIRAEEAILKQMFNDWLTILN